MLRSLRGWDLWSRWPFWSKSHHHNEYLFAACVYFVNLCKFEPQIPVDSFTSSLRSPSASPMARRTKACPVGQRGRVGAWHWVCTGSCTPFTSWNLESSNWSFWNETALFRANLLHFASDQGRVIDDDRCTERNSIEVVLGTWWVCWRIRQENNSAFIPRRETCHIVSLLSSFAFSTRCIRLLCQGVEDSESGPAWLGLALWSPRLTWK